MMLVLLLLLLFFSSEGNFMFLLIGIFNFKTNIFIFCSYTSCGYDGEGQE